MEIEYIAFDSFGVKSSCILVKTDDVIICVDPGIACETNSFPIPLKERLEIRYKYEEVIEHACQKADVITISHYHYDHFQNIKKWYENKTLLIKNPKVCINKSQTLRASYFLNKIKDVSKSIKIADGKKYVFGGTKIRFSKPLFHGVEKTKLGYILMTTIYDSEKKVLHSSDVHGPIEESYADIIIKESPDILILDGAPTYLLGYIHSFNNLCRAITNLNRIIKSKKIEKIILDHHLLRDYRYRDLYYVSFKTAEKFGIILRTAAEEIHKKPIVLEGYEKYGPTKWIKWKRIKSKDIENGLKNKSFLSNSEKK